MHCGKNRTQFNNCRRSWANVARYSSSESHLPLTDDMSMLTTVMAHGLLESLQPLHTFLFLAGPLLLCYEQLTVVVGMFMLVMAPCQLLVQLLHTFLSPSCCYEYSLLLTHWCCMFKLVMAKYQIPLLQLHTVCCLAILFLLLLQVILFSSATVMGMFTLVMADNNSFT